MKAHFTNTVKAEWLADGWNMRLLEDVSFVDSSGKEWKAYAGEVVNGASIPRFFWRIIGSPFVGKYRRPSVIHDVYCDRRDEPHEAVHAMFKEAMECDGVPSYKVDTMFNAVDKFGPKWDENGNDLETQGLNI